MPTSSLSVPFSKDEHVFKTLIDGLPKYFRELLDRYRDFGRDPRVSENKGAKNKYELAFSLRGQRIEFSISLKDRHVMIRLTKPNTEAAAQKIFTGAFKQMIPILMRQWFISYFNGKKREAAKEPILETKLGVQANTLGADVELAKTTDEENIYYGSVDNLMNSPYFEAPKGD